MTTDSIITLDLSTNCGFCSGIDEPEFGCWLLEPYTVDRGAMLSGLRNELTTLIGAVQPTKIIIEQRPPPSRFSGGTNQASADQQTYLEAQVYMVGFDEGVKVEQLNARHVRSAMIPGGAQITSAEKNKGAIVRWAHFQGYQVFDHNAADALLMWLYWQNALPRVAKTRKKRNAA